MINRETVRDQLVTLLSTDLVTNLGIVVEVKGSKILDPQGRGPLVAVLSAGSSRPRATAEGHQTAFFFDVQIWTPYGTGQSEASAEDRADQIEKEIAELVEANCDNEGYWFWIGYAGRSTAVDIQVQSGNLYIFEVIPLEVHYFG